MMFGAVALAAAMGCSAPAATTAEDTPVPPSNTPVVNTPAVASTSEATPGAVTLEIASGSVARYIVGEQLARVSTPGDAIGETSDVSGTLAFDSSGTVVPGSSISVDLRTLESDEDRRDNFIKDNSLESNRFPMAEFAITEVTGLPWPLPESGEAAIELHGDMTVHGVTLPLTWTVNATFGPDGVTGQANTVFKFSDFDIEKPSLFFIVSVDDEIRLEVDFITSIES
jgi:polyisoprenoid-binding protein YceI